MALLVALAAAFLIALAVPITGTQASQEQTAMPVAVAGDGLAAALLSQAETVAGVVAETGTLPVGQGPAYAATLRSVPGAALVPQPLLIVAGRVAARGVLSSPETQASLIIQRQEPVAFTVHQQGFASAEMSSRLTVGQALASAGIRVGPHDLVSPALGAALTPGLHVYVRYANRLELTVGGTAQTVYTHAATVGGALAEAGVQLEAMDDVSPNPNAPVRNGLAVTVTVVRDTVEYVDDPIAFDTIYRYDPELLQGKEILIQAGSDGFVRREFRLRYVDGAEVDRQLISESETPATDQIISRGTAIPVYTMPAPEGELVCARTLSVYATWYTAASAGGSGHTATGLPVTKGVVAVDPRVIPLGTHMYIPGYGYGLAADTGGGIKGNIIDLGYGPGDVYDWSSHRVEICILG